MHLSARPFRTGLLLLLACGVVWAIVLAWWADEQRTPSGHDMALYMAALPLTLVGGFLLLKNFIDGFRRAVIATPPTASNPIAEAPPTPARAHGTPVAIHAGFLRTAAADDPHQLRNALAEGKRPTPDLELRDAEGFPVFSARIDALACEVLRCELDDLAESLHLEAPGDPAILRALAALDLLLPESLGALADPGHEVACEATVVRRILWFVPHTWPPHGLALLAAWLRGRSDEPALRQVDPLILPARSANDLAQQLAAQAARLAPDERLLVLAAQSFLTEDTLLHWTVSGRLFSPRQQQGCVPGEASAALLLSPCGGSGAGQQALAMMSSPVSETRAHSADAAGRTDTATLCAVLAGALEGTGLEPACIAAVVSDIDHRATRSSELFGALGTDFEHLDPTLDVLAAATSCGDTGIVSGLLCIILAGETARERTCAALCLFAQDALERAALVLTPVAEPPIN